uniref:MTOR-associated protein MEAK7 n=1 Tax=Clastoptera arizonana TaxID=38151 RepID=A0A1B6C7T1_9HEMI
MGGKSSKSDSTKKIFQPSEEEIILSYLGLKNISDKISPPNLKGLWQNLLEPSLLDQIITYLIKQSKSSDSGITMSTLSQFYVTFVRGTIDEVAVTIMDLIGGRPNSDQEVVTQREKIVKYTSNLISSYLKILDDRKDRYLNSWSADSRKLNSQSLISVVEALCSELDAQTDVTLDKLERFLSQTCIITQMNSWLATSLLNLRPQKTNLFPKALLPNPKTPSILDAVQIIYMNSLLPLEFRSQWRFLFSTATHGESFSSMMGSIMNQGPTLVVVRDTALHTFGGFASDSWSPNPKFVGNETCFLFKLAPAVKVFTSTGYNNHYMYVNCNQPTFPNGLGMGGQFGFFGFWLDSDFGHGESSDFCITYRNYEMLSAEPKFNIRHLEIWGVGDPPPTPEELGERPTTSVLDKDPTVTQMLEMIGRKQHSKGLRESPGRVRPVFPTESSDEEDKKDKS